MKKYILIILGLLIFTCSDDSLSDDSSSDDSSSTDTSVDVIPSFTLISNVNVAIVGTPYLLMWNIDGSYECQLSGAINTIATGNSSIYVNPEEAGEQITILTCGSESVSVSVEVLPEYIDIPDVVFADALTRLGFPVINGQMNTSDALIIENFIITSMNNYYGDADSNGTTTFENAAVPDNGAKVAYTLNGEYITDTSGLESFRNLKTMRLEMQQFDEIDLSTLKKLSFMSLWRNPILDLDLSNNTELTYLGLSETGLTSLDTSELSNLVEVAFQQGGVVPFTVTTGNETYTVNGFSSLDFSNNSELKRIYLNRNPLTNLGLGENNKNSLREVWASETDIESLDLSGFSSVNYVILNSSKNLSYLNLYGINNNQVPYRLYCEGCPNLNEIQVTNVNNYQEAVNAQLIWVDGHISFVEGP